MRKRSLASAAMALGLLLQVGCLAHLKGVVVDPATSRPVPGAVLTDGAPDNQINFVKYPTDAEGKFDIRVPILDKSFIYVWNGQGGSAMVYRRINSTEFGTDMIVKFSPTPKGGLSGQYGDPWGTQPVMPVPAGP